MPEYHTRSLMLADFLVDGRMRFQPIDGRDEESIHSSSQHATYACGFSLWIVQGMSKKDVIACLVGALLNRHHDAGIDRVGGCRNDQSKESCLATSESSSCGVWNIPHLIGQSTNPGFGAGGDIRGVPHDLRDGHHGNVSSLGDIFESDHTPTLSCKLVIILPNTPLLPDPA